MWAMSKRIFLFVLVNFLIITTISITWSLVSTFIGLPMDSYYGYLIVWSLVFGMGGAFVSLLMSKFMARMMMGVKIIDPSTTDPTARALVQKVYALAQKAGLSKMPEVGIYDSDEVNAFATGPSRRNSLVAVSRGLLQRMDDDAVEGVLAHEVAHVANGDMVTMTLLQGVINALVLFFARLIASVVASQSSNREESGSALQYVIYMVLQILFSILGAIVVNWFSRYREYRADAGGANLAGRKKMVSALRSLSQLHGFVDTSQEAMATLKISDRPHGLLARLFSTHPPLADRIRRLESGVTGGFTVASGSHRPL